MARVNSNAYHTCIVVFYTTPGGLAVQPQPAPVRQVTPQTYQKREKKALKILDPTTLEEINVSGGKTSTPPQSGSSSSRATPVTQNVCIHVQSRCVKGLF